MKFDRNIVLCYIFNGFLFSEISKMDKNINRGEKKKGLGNGCALYKKCGGCQLQNMTYAEQLSFKQAKTIKALGRFGHVEEIIGMREPYHYRNKVQAAFGVTRGGKIISGVYQSSSHRIVCIDNCRLEDRKADKIIVTIRNLMKNRAVRPCFFAVREAVGNNFRQTVTHAPQT